jgi:hypothetical protein
MKQFYHTASNGTTYYLNAQTVTLRGGRQQVIYFFSRDAGRANAAEKPAGYEIAEGKNGLPHLKKVKAA